MADSSTMRGIRTSTRSLMTARPHLPERESASPEMIVLRSGYARLGPFNPGPFSSRLTLLSHLDCRRAGAPKALCQVAQSLYKKAIGDGPQAVTAAIFIMKTRGGWKESKESPDNLSHEDALAQLK